MLPLSHPRQGISEDSLAQCQAFGFEIEAVSESRLLVRAIPQALPDLDLPRWLSLLSQGKLANEDWFSALLDCQSLDLRQWTPDQQAEVQALAEQTKIACRRLDLEQCQRLMANSLHQTG